MRPSADAFALPLSVDELRERVRAGLRPKFVFFWGHTSRSNALGPECLSQWYPARFEVDGVHFPTAEHFMMWSKARLFADDATAHDILSAPSPGAAKSLGRKVHGFSQTRWDEQRPSIVVAGNVAKFGQTPALREYLLATRKRILVEASPTDTVWGIGLDARDPRAQDPASWRGLNLLGFALMHARERLAGST